MRRNSDEDRRALKHVALPLLCTPENRRALPVISRQDRRAVFGAASRQVSRARNITIGYNARDGKALFQARYRAVGIGRCPRRDFYHRHGALRRRRNPLRNFRRGLHQPVPGAPSYRATSARAPAGMVHAADFDTACAKFISCENQLTTSQRLSNLNH
jgi:hypothetical protein